MLISNNDQKVQSLSNFYNSLYQFIIDDKDDKKPEKNDSYLGMLRKYNDVANDIEKHFIDTAKVLQQFDNESPRVNHFLHFLEEAKIEANGDRLMPPTTEMFQKALYKFALNNSKYPINPSKADFLVIKNVILNEMQILAAEQENITTQVGPLYEAFLAESGAVYGSLASLLGNTCCEEAFDDMAVYRSFQRMMAVITFQKMKGDSKIKEIYELAMAREGIPDVNVDMTIGIVAEDFFQMLCRFSKTQVSDHKAEDLLMIDQFLNDRIGGTRPTPKPFIETKGAALQEKEGPSSYLG